MCHNTKNPGHHRSLHYHLMANNIIGPYIKKIVVWYLSPRKTTLNLRAWDIFILNYTELDVDFFADILIKWESKISLVLETTVIVQWRPSYFVQLIEVPGICDAKSC